MKIPYTCSELIKISKLNINDYTLVNLINKRVSELIYGAKPLVSEKKMNYLQTAISEIMSGKIKPQDM